MLRVAGMVRMQAERPDLMMFSIARESWCRPIRYSSHSRRREDRRRARLAFSSSAIFHQPQHALTAALIQLAAVGTRSHHTNTSRCYNED